jgi:hypothetical protein
MSHTPETMATVSQIAIADIDLTAGTQVRGALDEPTVHGYAVLMAEGAEFPPVRLMRLPDGRLVPVDGFHRIAAATRNKLTAIEAVVTDGTLDEARLMAAGANRAHGLRLTTDDKHRAITLVLDLRPTWSSRQVAAHIGCSDGYVRRVVRQVHEREQVGHVPTFEKIETSSSRVVGRDGKSYPRRPLSPASMTPQDPDVNTASTPSKEASSPAAMPVKAGSSSHTALMSEHLDRLERYIEQLEAVGTMTSKQEAVALSAKRAYERHCALMARLLKIPVREVVCA